MTMAFTWLYIHYVVDCITPKVQCTSLQSFVESTCIPVSMGVNFLCYYQLLLLSLLLASSFQYLWY